MTWLQALVPLMAAILGAVVGGFVVHRLTLTRESLTARRTQRVAFLLAAYRKLIDASERRDLSPQHRDNLEGALADIMLLGGEEEIGAADSFQRDFAEEKDASLTPVIKSLRTSLRNELSLPEVDLPERFNFRIYFNDEYGKTSHDFTSDQPLFSHVADKADILRKINEAQKLKTGRELTGERKQQVLDAYDPDHGMSARQVLWVDDNEDSIVFEREMLESAGVSSVWVPNTSRALELLGGNEFLAVISDMGRPEGDREGFALLDAMRRHGDDTPFIVYSGSDDPAHLHAVLDRYGQGATNDPSRLFELVMKQVASQKVCLDKPRDSIAAQPLEVRGDGW